MCLLESQTGLGFEKLCPLRKSDNISSQVTTLEIWAFFLTPVTPVRKPRAVPTPRFSTTGGPAVGEGTWDFVNCQTAKAEWEHARELNGFTTR